MSTRSKQYSLFSINFLLDKEPRKISSDEFNSSDDDHIDVESRSSQGSSSQLSSSSIRPSVIKLDVKCDKKGMNWHDLALIEFALFRFSTLPFWAVILRFYKQNNRNRASGLCSSLVIYIWIINQSLLMPLNMICNRQKAFLRLAWEVWLVLGSSHTPHWVSGWKSVWKWAVTFHYVQYIVKSNIINDCRS